MIGLMAMPALLRTAVAVTATGFSRGQGRHQAQVRNTHASAFWFRVLTRSDHLPRQARDKYEENRPNEKCFLLQAHRASRRRTANRSLRFTRL